MTHHPAKVTEFGLRNAIMFMSASLLVIFFAFRIMAVGEEEQITIKRLPVSVSAVKLEQEYSTWHTYTGRAVAARSSRLAFEQAGTLTQILVDEGAKVRAGQLLARLDTDRLNAQKSELSAEREELAVNVALAGKNLTRARKTFAQGHVSAQRLDEMEANLMGLKARVKRLAASEQTLDIALEKSNVYAPYDGEIISRLLDEGAVVAAGTPVFHMRDAATLEAHVGVAPKDAKVIASGGDYILLNSQRKPVVGHFKAIVASIIGQTRTMKVVFTIDDDAVYDGEIIHVRTRKKEKATGAWLPIRAISADVRGLWRVYKVVGVGENQTVVYENIQLLHTESDRVYVTGSLADGDIIISGGINRLAPGQHVTVIDAAESNRAQAARQ